MCIYTCHSIIVSIKLYSCQVCKYARESMRIQSSQVYRKGKKEESEKKARKRFFHKLSRRLNNIVYCLMFFYILCNTLANCNFVIAKKTQTFQLVYLIFPPFIVTNTYGSRNRSTFSHTSREILWQTLILLQHFISARQTPPEFNYSKYFASHV